MTRKDKIFDLAKGFRGRAKNCFRIAIRRVEKGLQYAYRTRKLRKRIARREWIMQVSAGSREHGLAYSSLIQGMHLSSIGVDRKMLAQLAQQEPYSFRAIVEEAKGALRRVVLHASARGERTPTMEADAQASSTVERGNVPAYEGPPLPPYPQRIRQYS
jgi:large subunit ribosomal protein L20